MNVHTLLLFVKKGSNYFENEVLIKKPKYESNTLKINKENIYKIKQKEWNKTQDCSFEIRLIGKTGQLVKKIVDTFPRLEESARASLGCQAYNISKHTKQQIENRVYHSSIKLSDEYLEELAGNDVKRYSIERKKGEWIKYGPWLHDYRTMDWLVGPRILIREIPGKSPYVIQAVYTERTYCNYKTILNINSSIKTDFSMKYLCGILNSKLLSFIYPFCSNKINADSFPRISVRDLKSLPVKNVDFNNITEKKLHDRIVLLVTNTLAYHIDISKAKTPQEKILLHREIEATDQQIDRLVYELYGLTTEEIRIVEGK